MTTNKNVIEKDVSAIPKYVPILIILLVATTLSLLLLRKFMPPRIGTVPLNFVQATQVFTPGKAMTITSGNVSIYVPKDSVNLPGTISVVSQEPNLYNDTSQANWTRPQIIEVQFLNTQATPVPNIVFSNAVQICFKLTPEQWDDFAKRPDAYQVQYYAVENHPAVWQALPLATYADVSTLCGQTMHFSIFALAVRVDQAIPVTGLTATPTTVSAAPGAQRHPRRGTSAVAPTNTAPPLPAATQPQPLPTNTAPPAPTETPAPTEPPPTEPAPTEPAPTNGLPIPTLSELPTLPVGP